jgi:LysM repeat protein
MKPFSARILPRAPVLTGVVLTGVLLAGPLAAQEVGEADLAAQGGDEPSDYPPPVTTTRSGAEEDINAYLPSSSRPTVDGSGDGFDLNQRSSSGSVVLKGGGGAEDSYDTVGGEGLDSEGRLVVRSQQKPVPEFHMVKKGDTLWDLSQNYYENPRDWPRLWSMNPQLENPHWIYPGDQLRTAAAGPGAPGASPNEDNSAGRGGFVGREHAVGTGTIFLRDQGYIGDPERDVWGELVGAKEEVMMLAKGDTVYLIMNDGVDVRIGQRLNIFNEVRSPKRVEGARKPPGELVKVYGTVRVDAWDPDKLVARGVLIESLDVVERGAKVGPVGRRFDVVPPRSAAVDLEARILTSIYPHIYFAQHQVVFIDKGSDDGLLPGNRLRAVRHGDTWRRELRTASKHARMRVPLDDPHDAPAETTPLHGDDEAFPDEIVGEVMVLRTEEYSSICIVVESTRPLLGGEKLVAVSGY